MRHACGPFLTHSGHEPLYDPERIVATSREQEEPTHPGLIASLTLQVIDNSFEPRLHLLRHLRKARIANCLHGGGGIDG